MKTELRYLCTFFFWLEPEGFALLGSRVACGMGNKLPYVSPRFASGSGLKPAGLPEFARAGRFSQICVWERIETRDAAEPDETLVGFSQICVWERIETNSSTASAWTRSAFLPDLRLGAD